MRVVPGQPSTSTLEVAKLLRICLSMAITMLMLMADGHDRVVLVGWAVMGECCVMDQPSVCT